MKRVISLNKEARKKLKEGVNKATEAIAQTLGPKGCSALIYTKSMGIPLVLDDGASITKLLQDDDPVVNAGVALINEVANQADSARDGTTSATLIANSIISDAISAIESGASQKQLKRGVESATKVALEYIQGLTHKVETRDDLKNVAKVSSNDDGMAEIIADAVDKVGENGVIHVENGNGIDTHVDIVSGMRYERGYLSRFFVNQPDKGTFELKDCRILLMDHPFSSPVDAQHLLQMMARKGIGVFVIADNVEEAPLAWFKTNTVNGLKICAVKTPGYGDIKQAYLEDISKMTGATIIGSTSGIELDNLNPDADPSTIEAYLQCMGTADVVVSSNDFVMLKPNLSDEAKEHVENLKKQKEEAATPYDKQQLESRIANMTGAVAIIKVGGLTDTEVEAKKAKFEDAKGATKSALIDGYICGGGSAYLAASLYLEKLLAEHKLDLTEDEVRGYNIVVKALCKITKQLGDNSNDVGDVIVRDLKARLDKEEEPCSGYNAVTNEICNMYDNGIIDSTHVVLNSLRKASSIASTVIMTATVVTEQAEESDKINWSLAMRGR